MAPNIALMVAALMASSFVCTVYIASFTAPVTPVRQFRTAGGCCSLETGCTNGVMQTACLGMASGVYLGDGSSCTQLYCLSVLPSVNCTFYATTCPSLV